MSGKDMSELKLDVRRVIGRHRVFPRFCADALCAVQISADLCVLVRGGFSLGFSIRALIAKIAALNTPSSLLQAGRLLRAFCLSNTARGDNQNIYAPRGASLKVRTPRPTHHNPSRTYRMFFRRMKLLRTSACAREMPAKLKYLASRSLGCGTT